MRIVPLIKALLLWRLGTLADLALARLFLPFGSHCRVPQAHLIPALKAQIWGLPHLERSCVAGESGQDCLMLPKPPHFY